MDPITISYWHVIAQFLKNFQHLPYIKSKKNTLKDGLVQHFQDLIQILSPLLINQLAKKK